MLVVVPVGGGADVAVTSGGAEGRVTAEGEGVEDVSDVDDVAIGARAEAAMVLWSSAVMFAEPEGMGETGTLSRCAPGQR